MFVNDTVFILGAGASWHYGYPTGEELVDALARMAIRLRDHCRARLNSGQVIQELPKYIENKMDRSRGVAGARAAWEAVATECQLLIDRLKVIRPILIDYFLGWNESLQPVGKLLIAAVILECEAKYRAVGYNHNRTPPGQRPGEKEQDNWYRFLTHKLLVNCAKSTDLLKNKVRFITFNYDVSLEDQLYRSLTSVDLLNERDVRAFLEKDRITHVYGSVHPQIPTDDNFAEPEVARKLGETLPSSLDFQKDLVPRKVFLDQCLAAAKNLRSIGPHDKFDGATELSIARQWIDESSIVYILGYGFDENNNQRLRLGQLLRVSKSKHKSVMFTNLGDRNAVNKRASRVFYNNYNSFLGNFVHGYPSHGDYREKSVRSVYEALEKDFETLESLLVAGTKI